MDKWKKKVLDSLLLKNNNVKAQNILDKNKPKSLFRYRSQIDKYGSYEDKLKLELESLKNNKVWASAAHYFNDPFDSRFIFNIPDNCIDEKYISSMKYEVGKIVNKSTKGTYVSCFCESQYNIPMWSYYANEHSGFCVEYEYNELKELSLPVVYSNESVDILDYDEKKLLYCALRKSTQWNHENEWRMVKCINEEPFKRGKLLDSCKPKSIYLGCKADAKLKDDFLKYCNEEKVDLYQLKMSFTSYKLEKEEVIRF